MAKLDPLSQLVQQKSELRAKIAHLEPRLTTLEVTIADRRIRGARLQRLLAQRDGVKDEISDCRGQVELLDMEIRHREQARPVQSIQFAHEVGEDGLPVDSVRHLTW